MVNVSDIGKRLLLGRKLRSAQLGETLLPKRIALPVFASDALSSVAYAPDEIFLTLSRFGSEAFLGPAVALSIIRELGPVLAALMVTGRAGSALTAEIGIMRITEQIDALTVMALSPMRYLVAPSIFAGILTFPLMTAIFDVVGIFGGYLVGVELLGLSAGTYFGEMQSFVDIGDVLLGFWKSISFGIIVTWVCTYKGFHVGHGAEGVARATTQAVVMSSVLILVWDYFLGTVLP